jgi:DNA-binding CsgD family transcriptional regulator
LQGELAAPLVARIGDVGSPGQHWVSPDEREILRLVAEGLGNREIAVRIGRTEGAVRVTLNAIFKRLGVHSRPEAVAAVIRLGALD